MKQNFTDKGNHEMTSDATIDAMCAAYWGEPSISTQKKYDDLDEAFKKEMREGMSAALAAYQASPECGKVDVRLLNDAITLMTKLLAGMLTDTSFASPHIEDHRARIPSWVMTHFRHDHERRIQYVNDINQKLNWIRNATEKVRIPTPPISKEAL